MFSPGPIKPNFNHELSAESIKKQITDASKINEQFNKDLDMLVNKESNKILKNKSQAFKKKSKFQKI